MGSVGKCVHARKSKLGFLTPEAEWLAGPLAAWLKNMLSSPQFLGELIEFKRLKGLMTRYNADPSSLGVQTIVFRLALYESWARQFLQPRHIQHRQTFKKTVEPSIS